MSQNFFGRDPMVWWIGKVTDPKDGKWDKTLESQHMDDGKPIYSHRCRVRILGYHDTDDLKDEELPLAHILLPPNTTTVGGRTQTVQYQGGEVVLGFFFDGEEAQQPAIFATLYRQDFQEVTEDYIKDGEFNNTVSSTVRNNSTKIGFNETKNDITYSYTGTAAAEIQAEENTTTTTHTENFCETDEIAKITTEMKKFTQKLQLLQQLNNSETFIDPIYGGFVDMKKEVKLTASKIHNSMTGLVRRGRSWLIQESVGKFSDDLSTKVDRHLKFKASEATSRLNKLVYCNLEKIADDLNVEVKDVLHMEKRLSANDTPFDAPSDTSDSDDQIMSPSQYLEDSAANPADLVEAEQTMEFHNDELLDALKSLDDRSKDIILRRYLTDTKVTLHELADEYQVSAERIRQIEAKALRKLKHPSRSKQLKSFLES